MQSAPLSLQKASSPAAQHGGDAREAKVAGAVNTNSNGLAGKLTFCRRGQLGQGGREAGFSSHPLEVLWPPLLGESGLAKGLST